MWVGSILSAVVVLAAMLYCSLYGVEIRQEESAVYDDEITNQRIHKLLALKEQAEQLESLTSSQQKEKELADEIYCVFLLNK